MKRRIHSLYKKIGRHRLTENGLAVFVLGDVSQRMRGLSLALLLFLNQESVLTTRAVPTYFALALGLALLSTLHSFLVPPSLLRAVLSHDR